MVRPTSVRRLIIPAVAVLLLVSGCGSGDDTTEAGSSQEGGGTREDSTVPPPENPLAGRSFVSQRVTRDGEDKPLVDGTQIELSLDGPGTMLTVKAGCNTQNGAVTVREDALEVDSLATTEMGCVQELHEQDEWIAEVLTSTPIWELDGDTLTLSEAGGAAIEFLDKQAAEPDQPLEGVDWRVDGIIDGDSVSSVSANAVAILRFEDGRIDISIERCNQGSTTFGSLESQIQTEPPVMTRMACEPDVAEVESAILDVLDGTIDFGIEGDTLSLMHPIGKGLTLTAQ